MEANYLVNLIRLKYKSADDTFNPSVVLEQVPNGTGGYKNRAIDVAVFQMWASKGLTRSAFEIKVTRQDFLRELAQPEKHKWCKEYFHEFWFVAPKDIIQVEELPNGVGWFYPRGNQLCVGRRAVRNDNPKLDDVILAAFMRAAHKAILESSKTTERELLANNQDYQRAVLYQKATLAFLDKRNISPSSLLYNPKSIEEIITVLDEATMDKELKADREYLLSIAGRFQRSVAELVGMMMIISNHNLVARNELGKHIVDRFGGYDDEAIESLRELEKKGKFIYQKRYADLVETILSWERNFESPTKG